MHKNKGFILFSLLLLLGLLGGCSAGGAQSGYENGGASAISDNSIPSLDDDDEYLEAIGSHQVIADPIEPWNRFWFKFNDVTYDYVLRPLHKGYAFITPQPVRTGIGNFFTNLGGPVRMINCLLQGKGNEAGVEFSSFVLNSTLGLGGLVDLASRSKPVVEPTGEDGGQTLGVWGLGEGMYIVWPLLGPSNVRDSLGMGMDYFMSPTTYLVDDWRLSVGMGTLKVFNSFDEVLDTYDTMKGMSVEPYTSLRDAFTQYRRSQIAK